MKRLMVVVCVVLGALLSGCASVPTSGPVVRHEQQQEPREGGVEIVPDPPARGASAQLIVEGFLHAMATFQVGHPVAKQYLTAGAAAAWQPDSQVQVYAEGSPRSDADNRVELRSRLVGHIDARGGFQQRDEVLVHDFKLVREAGEWRISAPPPGLLIADYLFRNTYREINLYYLDREDDRVIPDQVFVPRGAPDLTHIVRTLLAGPSEWLAPVVRPVRQPAITVTSVREQQGTAEVRVSREALSLADAGRTRLVAQLAWTLGQFDAITGVRVLADGDPLWVEEADTNSVVQVSAMARFAPVSDSVSRQLFGVQATDIVRVTEDESGASVADSWQFTRPVTGFAADAQALQGAVVLEGRELLAGPLSAAPQPLRQEPGLVRPQFLGGELWSLTSAPGGAPRVWTGGREVTVQAPALVGEQVVAFRISPDGTRMAVVSSTSGGRLGLVRITRGGQVTLEGWTPLRLGAGLSPRDVGWLNESTLAVAYDSEGRSGVVTTDLGGAIVSDLHLLDARSPTSIATSSRLSVRDAALTVCDPTGVCYRYSSDQRWTALRTPLRLPTYPS